jgi:methylglutaconyl-CoA hydratase
VQEVADDLDAAIDRVVGELLSAAPAAARAAKELARAPLPADETAKRIAAHRTSAEGQEGLRAFLEKRRAKWAEDVTNHP